MRVGSGEQGTPRTSTGPDAALDAIVIGGGMAGLAAADELLRAGRRVVVLEADADVGGLARAVSIGGEPIERYYHHLFPQDREALELIDRLGLGGRLEWLPGPMGVMHRGVMYPFDSPFDVLRFGPLSPCGRLRLAAGTAAQVARPDAGHRTRTRVGTSGPAWFGGAAYDLLWRPLLEAKFGDLAPDVCMSWLVARIRQRAGARGAKGDRLGYLGGSLATLATALADDLRTRGARVLTSTQVTGLRHEAGRWHASVAGGDGAAAYAAPSIVACVSGPILSRMVDLPRRYADAMAAIPYRGIVCALVELDRPLGRYYWVNVTDRLGLGCVGIIEHTNLVPAERYGGRSLVYLAHYVDASGPTWTASAEELLAAVEPAFRSLNPSYEHAWVRDIHVSRDRFGQPVPLVGGPMPALPMRTGLPGLVHASLAHVFPDDRGVSMALRLGSAAARDVLAEASAG